MEKISSVSTPTCPHISVGNQVQSGAMEGGNSHPAVEVVVVLYRGNNANAPTKIRAITTVSPPNSIELRSASHPFGCRSW